MNLSKKIFQKKSSSFIIILLFGLAIYALFVLMSNYMYRDRYITGSDFKVFYSAAIMIRHGVTSSFYDLQTQYIWQRFVVPQETLHQLLPYLNPPFVAILFVPFSFLPLTIAYHLWNIVSLIVFIFILLELTKELPLERNMRFYCLIIVSITSPLLLVIWLFGQLSVLLLLSTLMGWRCFKSKRFFQSGLFLSFLLIKPQFILVPVLAFVAKKYWKIILGIISGGTIFLFFSLITVGIQGSLNYIPFFFHLPFEGRTYEINPVYQGNIWSLLYVLFFRNNIFSAVIIAVVFLISMSLLFLLRWKNTTLSNINVNIFWSELILVTLITSLHVNPHDLILLFIPFTILLASKPKILTYIPVTRAVHFPLGIRLSKIYQNLLLFTGVYIILLFLALSPELLVPLATIFLVFRFLPKVSFSS